MDSNIVFESNVYPVTGSIENDKLFLSKIWDYNRLHEINEKYFQGVPWTDIPWSEFQRTIMKETPYCAYNRSDPCWGMVKKGTEYKWICMCTKTDCYRFSRCRSSYPYQPEVEKDFVPIDKPVDTYGYRKFISEYKAYPVLVGDAIKHNYKPLPLKPIPTAEPIPVVKPLPPVEPNPIKPTPIVKSVPVGEPVPVTKPIKTLPANPLNIFDYFSKGTQSEIIKASPADSFFVDAGPGTGKTYTLIQKLNHMVTNDGVEADGILVLCFTNVAVDEIKTRLKSFISNGGDRSLINIDVRTFHSFAWWLINEANTTLALSGWMPVFMPGLSYETSLIKAGEVIERFGKDVVKNWEYFIVDEVQDLTNTLGRFVLKIVKACLSVNCGVTVLGDACQAIYDYEQETLSDPLKSPEFYSLLYKNMNGKAKFIYLTENHRQKEELINLTSGLRTAILTAENGKMLDAVDLFKSKADIINMEGSSVSKDALDKLRKGGSISLLFRNNGETLIMSSDLRKRGVPHTLNINNIKNNFAPWIADVFSTYKKKYISEKIFLSLYNNSNNDGTVVWHRLQRLLHTNNDELNVRDLLNAIAVSKIDDPLLRAIQKQKIIVSNIHRSKGREYDCVILDQSFVDSFSSDTKIDEYKTLYVAATRPKKRLVLSHLLKTKKLKVIYIFDSKRKRWGSYKGRKLVYFEFDSLNDLDIDSFAAVPSEIISDIAIGDAVWLQRVLQGNSIKYEIVHENTEKIIGTLNIYNNYITDIKSYMQIGSDSLVNMPSSIKDLYVSGIYSQVVDTQYLELHPEIRTVAPNGVWKWVELVGMGHAVYDVY